MDKTKQTDVYLRDLRISDTISITDQDRNGEESFDELYLDCPDTDTLIGMVYMYQ